MDGHVADAGHRLIFDVGVKTTAFPGIAAPPDACQDAPLSCLHHSISTLYASNSLSEPTIRKSSAFAWAMIMRSNGSRW